MTKTLTKQGNRLVFEVDDPIRQLWKIDANTPLTVTVDGNKLILEARRDEISDQPMQVLIRCDRPSALAAKVFDQDSVVEARLHADGGGLLIKTRDAHKFYRLLNHIALNGIEIESVSPADDNVNSVYEYLIGGEGSR